MARARQKVANVGVEVDGLAESMRALAKVDKALRKEATDAIRDHTKPIAIRARKNAARTAPGVPKGTTRWIGHSVIAGKGAAIVLKVAGAGDDDPRNRAIASEFGESSQKVGWGKRSNPNYKPKFRPQRTLKRRVFNPHRKKGYIIQPTIKRMLPETLDGIADDLAKVYSKALTRAGVPRGT